MVKEKYARVHLLSKQFDEQLKGLIEQPPSGSVVMDITPSMAADMLKHNTDNRPLSPNLISYYGIQMKTGDWHYTRVPIIFSESGKLIDGQHRLSACVSSGVTIKCDVSFGAPDDAFAFIDVGKKRSAADIFAINDVPWAALMSAASLRLISITENWPDGMVGKNPGQIPVHALYEYYCANIDLQDSATTAAKFSKQKLMAPSLAAALHCVCARRNRRLADEFFQMVATGIGIPKSNHPANRLRDRLIANAVSDEKMSARRISALTLKAWNAFRDGRSIGVLRIIESEAFPKAK